MIKQFSYINLIIVLPICRVYISLEIYCVHIFMLTNTMHHDGREQCWCDTHVELSKLFTCPGASPGVGKLTHGF